MTHVVGSIVQLWCNFILELILLSGEKGKALAKFVKFLLNSLFVIIFPSAPLGFF